MWDSEVVYSFVAYPCYRIPILQRSFRPDWTSWLRFLFHRSSSGCFPHLHAVQRPQSQDLVPGESLHPTLKITLTSEAQPVISETLSTEGRELFGGVSQILYSLLFHTVAHLLSNPLPHMWPLHSWIDRLSTTPWISLKRDSHVGGDSYLLGRCFLEEQAQEFPGLHM